MERREKWEGLDSSGVRECGWEDLDLSAARESGREKWESLDSSAESESAREKWEGLLSGVEGWKREWGCLTCGLFFKDFMYV